MFKKSNTPILEHIHDFIDYCDVEKGLSLNTQKDYEMYLRRFIRWLRQNNLHHLKPHELTPEHIWDYRLYLSRTVDTGQTLQKTTQNYYLIALRALLSYFTARDILSIPSEKVNLPKDAKSEKTIKFLNLDQLERLLLAAKPDSLVGLRDRAILETFFSTGLRVAELVSLNLEQFTSLRGDKELELAVVGKGKVPRVVYFSERALSWVKRYIAKRCCPQEKALFVSHSSNAAGNLRLSTRSVERIVKKYAILAGVPLFTTPHTLRHTYATDLLNQGADLRSIQEFLGHKSIMTTQIYTHVTNKRLKDMHSQFHSGKNLKN